MPHSERTERMLSNAVSYVDRALANLQLSPNDEGVAYAQPYLQRAVAVLVFVIEDPPHDVEQYNLNLVETRLEHCRREGHQLDIRTRARRGAGGWTRTTDRPPVADRANSAAEAELEDCRISIARLVASRERFAEQIAVKSRRST